MYYFSNLTDAGAVVVFVIDIFGHDHDHDDKKGFHLRTITITQVTRALTLDGREVFI